MKRMIDSDKIKVNNNGELEINAPVKFNEDIDASGVNLTIGDITLPEDSGQSVKKIYCHPITFSGTNYAISLMILNNDPTPIDSLGKLHDWIQSIYAIVGDSIRINCSGGYSDGSNTLICDHISYGSNTYYITGLKNNIYAYQSGASLSAIFGTPEIFNDGVNAIT